MKRIFMLACSALLIVGATALAAPKDQDKTERPRRTALSSSGYLGIEIEEVTSDVASRLRLREERGAWITGVTGDTAAAKAGLQKDDVIVRWNGEPVESARALSRHIRETPAGRSVKLGVLRNGSEMEVAVTLGDRGDYLSHIRVGRITPRPAVAAMPAIAPRARVRVRDGYRLGISLQSMSPQLAEYFGLQNRSGALVTFVHPDSAAAKAGIKAGDVILSVGGETVDHPGRVIEVMRSRAEGPLEVKVMRDRQERSLTVQLEKGKTSMIWPEEDDVVVSEALAAPIEIGPINIAPFEFAPVALPQIHFEMMAMPSVHIAPLPAMALPKMKMPKIVMPPLRIVIPEMVFRTEV